MAFESLRDQGVLGIARIAGFYLSVVVFLFFWALAFGFGLVAVFTAWFDPALANTIHFVHDIALHTMVWVWGAAMLAQLYRPTRRVTAMQVALVVAVIDAGVSAVAGTFDPAALAFFFGPVFVAAALHPARGELLGVRGFDRESVDPVLLLLVGLAVVPVVLYVLGQLDFQQVLADEHADLGHYATMAYYGLIVLALGGLAAIGNRGRRFAAYGAGLMAAMLGIASVFQPTSSGLDATWSALAVLWALALVAAYEWSVRRDTAGAPVAPTEGSKAPP